MTGNILTPNLLWKDYVVGSSFDKQIISEKIVDEINYSEFYFNGKNYEDGHIQIYCNYLRKYVDKPMPTILLVSDFCDGNDLTFAKSLAKNGYAVLSIDIGGQREGVEKFTIYPKSLDYANLPLSNYQCTEIEGEIRDTCWYIWSGVVKYAIQFLALDKFVKNIGVIGFSYPATALWQAVATSENLSCAVFVANTGWQGYKGLNKFSGDIEPQFTDNQLKYLAGIEPQAYAKHVKCPCLILSPTNSINFDCDRAYDTISRIEADVFRAVDYCVGARESVSYNQYQNALTFFNWFLKKAGGEKTLPEWPDISIDVEDNGVCISVTPYGNNIREITTYVAEETFCPELRNWQTLNNGDLLSLNKSSNKNNTIKYQYSPNGLSGIVMAFSRVVYKNGLAICSNIISKNFTEEQINNIQKSRILYSSRGEGKNNSFVPAMENQQKPTGIEINELSEVKCIVGPMDITGITSQKGLLSFRINATCDKPQDEAILMLDAYVKNCEHLTIKLIADYFGEKTEYTYTAKIVCNDLWQNIKIEQNNFKSPLGMALKSYSTIQAIEISALGEYAINNVLWI